MTGIQIVPEFDPTLQPIGHALAIELLDADPALNGGDTSATPNLPPATAPNEWEGCPVGWPRCDSVGHPTWRRWRGGNVSIAFVIESDKVDQAGYDEFAKAIGRESINSPAPPGRLVHLAGPKPGGGWRTIDVWESEDAAKAFYESEQFSAVMNAADDMGITRTPWHLHRVLIEGPLRRIAEA
jgi:hypothetical protein